MSVHEAIYKAAAQGAQKPETPNALSRLKELLQSADISKEQLAMALHNTKTQIGDAVAGSTNDGAAVKKLVDGLAGGDLRLQQTDPATLALYGAGLGSAVGLGAGDRNESSIVNAMRGAAAGAGAGAGARYGESIGKELLKGNPYAGLIGTLGGAAIGGIGAGGIAKALT